MEQVNVRVSPSHSALEVLNEYNPIIPGAVYDEDGGIYLDDEKVGEWYRNIGGRKVRASLRGRSVADIEQIYHRAYLRYQRVSVQCHKRIMQLIRDYNPCYIPNPQDPDQWWRWECDNESFWLRWNTDPNATPTNLEVGAEVARLKKTMQQAGNTMNFAWEVLNDAIKKIVLPKFYGGDYSVVVIELNGRKYVYDRTNYGFRPVRPYRIGVYSEEGV